MKQHSLGLLDNLKKNIADLFPSYFALTMATGIVSIACHLSGIPFVGELLLYLNIIFYSILWMLLVCRVIFYFQNFAKDISDHARGSGFLTVVAGTNVLGTQFVVIGQNYQVAVPLYYLGLILWVVLIYSFFIIITVKSNKPSLEKGINGIWLLMVVATQSVSVLGTLLVEHLPFSKELTLFLSLTFFLFGCILYIILITLIFYRLTFFELRAEEFAPPYWINMGAVAIITLAGSVLILNSNHWELLAHLKPFLIGFTLMFWATATWWIPIIVILGLWRHVYQLIPLTYHPQYWGMIFPLGMYTVCTYRLAQATQIQFLFKIPSVFVYIAFGAWALALLGLLYGLANNFYSTLKRQKTYNS